MANLVGQDVGLRKVAAGSKPAAKLIVKAKIDVCLFILGTIERSHCGSRYTASRVDGIAEQDEVRVRVLSSALLKHTVPGLLYVVKDEGDKANLRLLSGI